MPSSPHQRRGHRASAEVPASEEATLFPPLRQELVPRHGDLPAGTRGSVHRPGQPGAEGAACVPEEHLGCVGPSLGPGLGPRLPRMRGVGAGVRRPRPVRAAFRHPPRYSLFIPGTVRVSHRPSLSFKINPFYGKASHHPELGLLARPEKPLYGSKSL